MVGVTTIDVPDGDRPLQVTLWYPAKAGGTSVWVGDSAVFEGVEGQQDAPIADGLFPMILIAHGGIRAAPNHGNWLGSGLAARGFVAAVVRGARDLATSCRP
jgi:predicted dienelactone hydrolase